MKYPKSRQLFDTSRRFVFDTIAIAVGASPLLA